VSNAKWQECGVPICRRVWPSFESRIAVSVTTLCEMFFASDPYKKSSIVRGSLNSNNGLPFVKATWPERR
jgi:hypothetical protein